MTEPTIYTSFCPRCDRAFHGGSQELADAETRAHLVRNDDDLHVGALEEWDDV